MRKTDCSADLNPTGAAGIRFVVRGCVTTSEGKPAIAIQVKAFDRNIGIKDTPLGEAITDAQGHYVITYSPDQFKGKSAADLVVALFRKGVPLQTSEVMFDAGPETVKDFLISVAAATEFEHLRQRIEPLMGGGPGKLAGTQISFFETRKKGKTDV